VNLNNKIATIIATLLLLSLAACSSAATPTADQPAETAIATIPPAPTGGLSDPSDNASTEAATLQPTQKPFVLEGAETTASGLQFLDVIPGDGAAPQEGDILSLNFTASLPDGTQFTNTQQESGKPITIVFLQDQILPGMDEGLGLMKVGGTARMVLPPELAFGEAGYSSIVPPNSQVILDVELISAEEPPQPTLVAASELTTTASGLKYADLTTGDGEPVSAGDIVSTQFTIWVQGEDEADYITSSIGREPLTFTQGAGDTVFPGWEEGMLGMQVGGKRLLVIPPELGLGQTGGSGIPADATLVMEVELVDRQGQPVLSRIPAEKLTTTESGLAYYDIVTGEGAEAASGQTVVVHYSGWLEDGTLFDSSVTRGEPFSFTLGTGGVIPGWEEGLLGMQVGGKRQLVIPANLAYGESGAGSTIPPDATLIFDIELLEIEGAE
jgi:peptidylprolyl isomerase